MTSPRSRARALQVSSVLLLLVSALLATCRPAAAQKVQVANLSSLPYMGWHRTTVDKAPLLDAGMVGDTLFVVGRQTGSDVHVVDLRVTLAPGQRREIDLGAAVPVASDGRRMLPWPANPLAHFGGAATVNGDELQWVSLRVDGAAYLAHLRGRTGRMFAVDLWLWWYPDQPAWCHGEALVTCSQPAVPDMGEAAPAKGIELRFGDAWVLPVGGAPWQLVPPGTEFADGQARLLPLSFVWTRHLNVLTGSLAVQTAIERGVMARGVSKLLEDGNPILPPGFGPGPWLAGQWAEATRRLHTWDAGTIGIPKESGQAGGQEDQVFVRGESFADGGVGCEWIAYLAACKFANRPCHHLEPDGAPLKPARHVSPRLVIWHGRAHWHTGVSPDRLGKPSGLKPEQANGWFGSDVEHKLFNTLAAAARLTGSPGLQALLAHQANLYMLESTTAAGWSNSTWFAARAVGWEGIFAVHAWRELEDRALAERVREHWRKRVADVLVPQLSGRDWWDPRTNDPRLGAGVRAMPWQQAVGAYGLDLACRILGPESGREIAVRAAMAVLRDAYVIRGGRWTTRDVVVLDNPEATVTEGFFDFFGNPLAAAVVLRMAPSEPRARAIWTQLVAECAHAHHTSWLAPGVQQ